MVTLNNSVGLETAFVSEAQLVKDRGWNGF